MKRILISGLLWSLAVNSDQPLYNLFRGLRSHTSVPVAVTATTTPEPLLQQCTVLPDNNHGIMAWLRNVRASAWLNGLLVPTAKSAEQVVKTGKKIIASGASCISRHPTPLLAAVGVTAAVAFRKPAAQRLMDTGCAKNNRFMMNCALRLGANIDINRAQEPYGYVSHAVFRNNLDLVQFLVDHHAALPPDELVHRACTLGNLPMVEFLINHGMSANDRWSSNHESVLQRACLNRNLPIATYLLEHGAHVNDSHLLFDMASQGDLEMVQCLVEHGAEINRPDHCPLLGALEHGRLDVMRYLLRRGANTERQGSPAHLIVPLCHAIDRNCDPAIIRILAHESTHYACSQALLRAVFSQKNDIIHEIVEHGNFTSDSDLNEPLQHAIEQKNWDLVRYFITSKPDINPCRHDDSHLCFAISGGCDLAMIHFLLDHGSLIDYKYILRHAAWENDTDSFLYWMSTIKKGMVRFDRLEVPEILKRAIQHKNFTIVRSIGGMLGHSPDNFFETLGQAVEDGCPIEMLAYLLEHGAGINYGLRIQNSALAHAIRRKDMPVVQYLVEHRATIDYGVLSVAASGYDMTLLQYIFDHYTGPVTKDWLERLIASRASSELAKDFFRRILQDIEAREQEERRRRIREEQETRERESKTQQEWIDLNQLSMSKLIETIDGQDITRIANIVEGLTNTYSPRYEQNAVLRWQKTLAATEILLPQEFRERFQLCTDKFRFKKLSVLVHPDKTRESRPEIASAAERIFKALANTYGQLQADPSRHPLQ